MYKGKLDNLYNDLCALVSEDSHFGFVLRDIKLDDKIYRVFDYGLVSWSDFQKPNAVNCRGTMFDITDKNNPTLVCLPPPKFFNYEEGQIDHTKHKVGSVMQKLDGSLISTYRHQGQIRCKSKGHILSDQAQRATALLRSAQYSELKENCEKLAIDGYTVNFEYTAPNNIIVIVYAKESLSVLSVRDNKTGELFFAENIEKKFPWANGILSNLVQFTTSSATGYTAKEQQEFVDKIRQETTGEGYVFEIIGDDASDRYLVKGKNLKYVSLHHAKDSIRAPSKLLECVIQGHSDDLRVLCAGDQAMIDLIEKAEQDAAPVINQLKHISQTFYETNKHLSRKDYAILARATFKDPKMQPLFASVMNPYLELEFSWEDMLIKYKHLYWPQYITHPTPTSASSASLDAPKV